MIQEINSSNNLIKFIEIGAGTPIASNFFNEPNASKTVYEVHSPYNNAREYYNIPEDVRLVSKEALLHIFWNLGNHSRCKYVVMDTFQILSNSAIIQHGWIAILSAEKFHFFHITLPVNFSRELSIKTIGKIGTALIHSTIFKTSIKEYPGLFIDNVLEYSVDSFSKSMFLETISQNCEEHLITIKDGNFVRFEDEYRGTDILVYKGSFNPIHEGHIKLIETAKEKYAAKPLFLISSNTYQKGTVDANNLAERIKKINDAGYIVGIMNNGFYWDNLNYLYERTFFKSKIISCLGLDSLSRLVDCYKNHEWSFKEMSQYAGQGEAKFMEEMFSDFKLAVFDRNIGSKNSLTYANLNIDFHGFNMNISSSEIRGG